MTLGMGSVRHREIELAAVRFEVRPRSPCLVLCLVLVPMILDGFLDVKYAFNQILVSLIELPKTREGPCPLAGLVPSHLRSPTGEHSSDSTPNVNSIKQGAPSPYLTNSTTGVSM